MTGIFHYILPRSGPKPGNFPLFDISKTFQKRQKLLWNKKLQSFCYPPKIELVAALAKVLYGTKGIRCQILLMKLSPTKNVGKCNWVDIFSCMGWKSFRNDRKSIVADAGTMGVGRRFFPEGTISGNFHRPPQTFLEGSRKWRNFIFPCRN